VRANEVIEYFEIQQNPPRSCSGRVRCGPVHSWLRYIRGSRPLGDQTDNWRLRHDGSRVCDWDHTIPL